MGASWAQEKGFRDSIKIKLDQYGSEAVQRNVCPAPSSIQSHPHPSTPHSSSLHLTQASVAFTVFSAVLCWSKCPIMKVRSRMTCKVRKAVWLELCLLHRLALLLSTLLSGWVSHLSIGRLSKWTTARMLLLHNAQLNLCPCPHCKTAE